MGRQPLPSRRAAAVALAVTCAVALLSGCAQPSHRFVTSDKDDVVIKLPRSWSVVRSGPPTAEDGTKATDGSWVAVYDSDRAPSAAHATAETVQHPVAIARTWVVDKEMGAQVTQDTLRDIVLPVSSQGRQNALLTGGTSGKNFRLIRDEEIRGAKTSGVRVTFSYDLGKGVEVFDQVALTTTDKTRVHLFFVHCNQTCWDREGQAIAAAVSSFTVKPA